VWAGAGAWELRYIAKNKKNKNKKHEDEEKGIIAVEEMMSLVVISCVVHEPKNKIKKTPCTRRGRQNCSRRVDGACHGLLCCTTLMPPPALDES